MSTELTVIPSSVLTEQELSSRKGLRRFGVQSQAATSACRISLMTINNDTS